MALAALMSIPVLVGLAMPPAASAGSGPAAGLSLAGTVGCAPHASTSPSSLLIPLAQPSGAQSTLKTGDVYGAQFEYQATKLPPHQSTWFYLPSTMAVFYFSNGSTSTFFFLHRSFSLSGGGWSSPVSANHTVTAKTTFSSGNAHLTTAWLAVMANATYGTAQIQFQWRWWVQPGGSGGKVQYGPWSHNINTAASTQQPSQFYPAPFVGVTSISAPPYLSGTNYTVTLHGNVSSTAFRMVIENTKGNELNSVCLPTPSGATQFNASIPLTNFTGAALPPGNYIAHVKNTVGAIVVFEKVSVT